MDQENQDVERRSRTQSADRLAFRMENKAMLPFRKRVEALQARVAFMIARAASSKTPEKDHITEAHAICLAIDEARAEVAAAITGKSLGPAENCQRALAVLRQRVEKLIL